MATALLLGATAGLLTYWGSTAVDGQRGPAANLERHEIGYSYNVDVTPPGWGASVAIGVGLLGSAGAWAVLRRRAERNAADR